MDWRDLLEKICFLKSKNKQTKKQQSLQNRPATEEETELINLCTKK